MSERTRVFGQTAVDFQERINFDRLRKQRLQKLQEQMKEHNLNALLLFAGENIRYAAGVWELWWKRLAWLRYCIVPQQGLPIMFETPGPDAARVKLDATFLQGRVRIAQNWKHSGPAESYLLERFADQVKSTLKEERINPKDPIGVDILDFRTHGILSKLGLNLVDGNDAISGAKLYKTDDELAILRIAAQVGDDAYALAKEEWIKPGVRECDVEAKFAEFVISRGFDQSFCIVASGQHTNPYLRAWTDKIIRKGEMVALDCGLSTYLGYAVDHSRSWPVHSRFTPEQKKIYKKGYDSLQRVIKAIRPGGTSKDIADALPTEWGEEEAQSTGLIQTVHSVGLGMYDGFWVCRGYSRKFPVEVKPRMYLAAETYTAEPGRGEGVRLEDNLVVTDTGIDIFTKFPYEEEALQE